MAWLFRHKLLALVIITAAVYWWVNPSHQFGVSYEGFVVYNHIPVFLLDCYISPDGKLHLESDLSVPVNINYWIQTHLRIHGFPETNLPLLVGTGFSGPPQFSFDMRTINHCHALGYEPKFLSSEEAIIRYNALKAKGTNVAILLKVK